MEAHAASSPVAPRSRQLRLPGVGAGLGRGVVVLYLSIIVLLPIAALLNQSLSEGIGHFWSQVSGGQARQSLELIFVCSLIVVAINAVFGTIVAWLLVRDNFPGKSILNAIIDLPFALPTIVVGVVLLFLYGPASPVKVDLFETRMGLMVALLFVTLPFSVRAVQPVLASLDGEAEAAAKSLGAGGIRTFVWVVLPSLWPAVLGGFGLAFARAIGEFGSISLIGGGIGRTTTASSYIYNLTQGFLWTNAASVSTALLVLSLVILVATSAFARRIQHRLVS
jgi:sulfate transport system permease protein